jgi:hypothetical protein
MRGFGLVLICFGISGCGGCSKGSAGADAGAAASARPGSVARDESGHLKPKAPRPPDNPADVPPQPTEELDADLDPRDPAHDYVERYVRATFRYGEASPCVDARTTGQSGGKAVVEVQRSMRSGCPSEEAPHETFLVDVAADRLETKGPAPLKKWPDGSDPGGPPAAARDIDAPSALQRALFGVQLTPIRFQAYGRGAYLLVTLAGWHAPLTPGAPPEATREFAAKVCAANRALPLAFMAGIDRSTVARVRCGDAPAARWDTLR